MRETHNPQISIFEFYGEHETGQQLKNISERLDAIPAILDIATNAIFTSGAKQTGRKGLTVDTIVRAALLKQMMGLTYDELSFYLQDSLSYSSFARVDSSIRYSGSCLQSCISKIDAASWEAINRLLLSDAAAKGIEKGRMVRIDSTVTETHISPPSDSNLLWDCVRVMVRLLRKMASVLELGAVTFCDRTRAAKRRMKAIAYSRGSNRVKQYKRLIANTKETRDYLYMALNPKSQLRESFQFIQLEEEAKALLELTEKVISQTQRRVFNGESVPHQEKVLSIFEPHTDIIRKGSRDIQYGHKLNLTTGKSGLVLDVYIEEGNPADAARLCPMLERQKEIYGRAPRQAAADGGYASQDNLTKAKEMGVKDVAFNKKRGLKVEDMVKSDWVYKKLYKFRAGVEGNISCLKRRFGLSRCNWKGLEKFKAYVWASSVAYNLLQLARIETAN
ncbi:ISNCY family transposase [Vibrio sp. JC009]|uniref:ISNCY family transposase n=1 Tax=Vibrio sp. JC009 TaxID=2912314 RepID=UPI0023B177C2|nr:ISNCY family transposase [Vibrio sp. JC009]WED21122.1 ISNCY family transposase [Vibrio sp. JC009]WED24727.1 ISNCY family transposase [Vibrio sp. JC009]